MRDELFDEAERSIWGPGSGDTRTSTCSGQAARSTISRHRSADAGRRQLLTPD